MQDPNNPVVNALPATVIILFLPMVIIEGYFAGTEALLWGSEGERIYWLQQWGYWPELFERAWQTGNWDLSIIARLFTYSFLNLTFMSTLFGGVMTLALGKFVSEALGERAFFVVFFVSALFGALVYTLVSAEKFPLLGAFPAAFGLIGAFSFVLFTKADGMKAQQLRAFQLLGLLMVLNWIFVVFFGAANTWIAELAAAICGFGIAALMRPQGVQILLERLRRN